MASRIQDIATLAIHGGRTLDSQASSMLFPLYQTGMFVHEAVGDDKGFSYSRVSNPTVDALEKAIGALEGTAPAVCFRSGMAAESALFFSVLKAGEHAILSEVTYGGTIRLFREILEPLGVHATFVDSSESRECGSRDHASNPHCLHRDSGQSDSDSHRHCRHRGNHQAPRPAARRR